MLSGISGGQLDGASRGRPQLVHMGLECLLRGRNSPVVPDLGRDKVILEVGVGEVRTAADKAASLDIAGAGGPRSVQEPLESSLDHPESKLLAVEAYGLGARLDDVDVKMVLKVLAHAGKMVDRVHSNMAEMISVANS